MALRDLPWTMMVISGLVAFFSYCIIRMVQVRRSFKDLVSNECRHVSELEVILFASAECNVNAIGFVVSNLSQPKPPHSFFWGHLKILGETFASVPSDVHYQVAVTTIAHKYNMPDVWYLDLWPAADGQIVIGNPDLAMYVTNTKNYPKHDAEKWFIDPLIGDGNIVTTNGPRWKHLHKMLSPAFSIQHIANLRPMVAAVSFNMC